MKKLESVLFAVLLIALTTVNTVSAAQDSFIKPKPSQYKIYNIRIGESAKTQPTGLTRLSLAAEIVDYTPDPGGLGYDQVRIRFEVIGDVDLYISQLVLSIYETVNPDYTALYVHDIEGWQVKLIGGDAYQSVWQAVIQWGLDLLTYVGGTIALTAAELLQAQKISMYNTERSRYQTNLALVWEPVTYPGIREASSFAILDWRLYRGVSRQAITVKATIVASVPYGLSESLSADVYIEFYS